MNQLNIRNRTEFRKWLTEHSQTEKECLVVIKRDRPVDDEHFWYIDAVEEVLCFGWIDSIWKNIDGVMWSRFSTRQNKRKVPGRSLTKNVSEDWKEWA